MLSLTSLAPRDVHTLWYTPSYLSTNAPIDLFPPAPPAAGAHAAPPTRKRREESASNPSALTLLLAEEAAIAARKASIRKFGATWIRPPGVTKTYQAMVDEAAERAEQEVLAQREAEMAAMRAAMEREEEAARQRAVWGTDGEGAPADAEGGGADDMGMEMERDLDEEVPEAEEVSFDMGVDLDAEEEEHNGLVGDVDEDETETETAESDNDLDDSRQHQYQHQHQHAHEHEHEHDLDDDVPEAGSYEHTDSELEDESSIPSQHPDTSSPPPPPSSRFTQVLLSPSPPTFSPQLLSSDAVSEAISSHGTSSNTRATPAPNHHAYAQPVMRGPDLRYSLTQSFIGTPALELDMEGESSLLVSSPIATRGGPLRRDARGGGATGLGGLFTPGSWGRERARRRGGGET